MVALVATVGAFTSCKDYDDDINDLRSQINGLETSLTTAIDQKTASVANQVTLLEQQLEKVKADYAAADQALDTQLKALQNADVTLQGGIDANKAKIEANLQAINDLKTEVANLYATKASLEAAKEALEKSLKETNDLLKAQGETIATLVLTDQTLEKGINEAKALATKAQEAADAAQKAADKVAADLATLSTKEDLDVANLQKQITENLSSLTKKIDDMNAALDARITANTTKIDDLSKEVAKNYATLVYVDAQFEAVQKANEKVADELKTAEKNLTQAITDGNKAAADALAAAKEALVQAIKDGDDAQAKALAAAQETLNKAIKDGDDAQAAALASTQIALELKIQQAIDKADANALAIEGLKGDITLLEQKHDNDMKAFIEEITKHTIPETVAAEIEDQLPKYYADSIKPYIDSLDAKNVGLIEALALRFEKDSVKLEALLTAQHLLAIQAIQFKVDSVGGKLRGEIATTAGELRDEFIDADNKIYQALADEKNADKEGSLANLIEAAKTALGNQISGVDNKVKAIQDFIGKDAEGNLSYNELAKSIAGTEAFGSAVENYVKSFYDELLSMVTSINLYANQHQAQDGEGGFDGFDHSLVFSYIVEKGDVKFPAAEGITDAQIEFKEGMFRSYHDSILVRVSPTNAKLTKEQVALINSQGKNIVADGVIEVVAVNPYTRDKDQYITRAENTGLWVIKFKIKEDKLGTGFKDAAYTKDNKSILYAVAAKSGETAADAADRYVISEYDLDLATADAYPGWDFDVNEISIADIHNRYIETDMEFVKTDIKEGVQKKTYKKELTWIGYGEAGKAAQPYADAKYYKVGDGTPEFKAYKAGVPAVSVITEGEKANATDRFGHTTQDELNGIDNRHKKEMLDVDVDQEIKISFPDFYDGDVNYPILVKGFYVTLDQEFALESYPSEYNQWTNYTYENVGYTKIVSPTETEVVKAKLFERKDGKTEGTIKIKNLGNVKGDVIGFRVYAVNIDGTLYDPDGRAFYVRVGNPYLTRDLAFNVFAETPANSGAIQTGTPIVDQNKTFDDDQTNTEDPFFNVDPDYLQNYNFVLTWGAENPKVLVGNRVKRLAEVAEGETGYIGDTDADLISDLFEFQCTPANPAKYGEGEWDESFKPNYKTSNVSVRLKAADRLINDTTYNLVLTIYKRNNNNTDPDLNSGSSIIEKVNIKVTKTMPNYLPEAFGVRISQENEAKDMKFYLRPLTTTLIARSVFGLTYVVDYRESWDITKWFDGTNADEKWGLTNIDERRSNFAYRWATDVRPFNFEEIFTGLVDENNNFDENYQFLFEGCGNVAKDDAEANAISTYRMYGSEMNYSGLDALKNPANRKPGYYLPYVYYGVLESLGTTGLPVKASYVYKGVSLKVEDDEIVPGNDYVSKPIYFDENGKEVAEANAAFVAKFICAIDKTFSLSFTAPNPVVEATGATGNNVPYGVDFTVKNTGSVTGTVSWKSDLAAFTNSGATGASYFKTNFNQFTSEYEDDAAKNASYYTVKNLKVNPEEATNGWANIYKQGAQGPRQTMNFLKLVDVNLGSKQLEITEVKIYKPGSTTEVEKTLNKANNNLDRINDYFTVSKNDNNGLDFKFKGDVFNPANLGMFEITLTSGAVKGKLLHQWGHTAQEASATSSIKVYYNRPNSDPNLHNARQAR
jgi:hypothetical protein